MHEASLWELDLFRLEPTLQCEWGFGAMLPAVALSFCLRFRDAYCRLSGYVLMFCISFMTHSVVVSAEIVIQFTFTTSLCYVCYLVLLDKVINTLISHFKNTLKSDR